MLTGPADPSILVGTKICQEMSKKGKYMMPKTLLPSAISAQNSILYVNLKG